MGRMGRGNGVVVRNKQYFSLYWSACFSFTSQSDVRNQGQRPGDELAAFAGRACGLENPIARRRRISALDSCFTAMISLWGTGSENGVTFLFPDHP